MTDPIFAQIENAELLECVWDVIDREAEAKFFALTVDQRVALLGVPEAERSKVHAAAHTAGQAMNTAIERLKKVKPTTLAGMEAKLDYLAYCGENVSDEALDIFAWIAERQPDLAVA